MTHARARLWLRNLCEVDPVVTLGVTQAVLVPIRLVAGRVHLLELIDRALPVCLHVDTDAAVQIALREVDMQIRYLGLGDLSLHLP